MKSRLMLIFVVMVCLLVPMSLRGQTSTTPSSPAQATVPRLIKFSGTLVDEQGHALKGPVGITFSLYAQQTGGAALWMETQNIKPDASGNYTVLLGAASANGIPAELFASGEARWLAMQVEKQPEQARVLLVSVPYALKAGDAQTLGGLPASAFLQAQGTNGSSAILLPAVTSAASASPSGSSGSSVPTAPIGGSGTGNTIAMFTGAATIGNSLITQSGGAAVVSEALQLPATGTASSTLKFNSQPFDLLASSFNSSTLKAVPQHFRWQAEPVGNNTTTPSGKLNLLFASGASAPAETGVSIAGNGIITFAPGQTIPKVTGNETVTGNVSATQLISTVATGTSPLKVTSTTQVANLNASLLGGLSASAFAQLAAPNTFTQTQTLKANLALPQTTGSAVGVVTMGGSSFLHACCPKSKQNTFFGAGAGNFTADATSSNGGFGSNTAVGNAALQAITSGFENTATGSGALLSNTMGFRNTATGISALGKNSSGTENTAIGDDALFFNTTGCCNTASGFEALGDTTSGTGSNNTASGFFALFGNTTGFNNTALGVKAGDMPSLATTTGNNNTFVGANSSPGTQTALNNATAIGANAEVTVSNALVLGSINGVNGATADALVGIGITNPTFKLQVIDPSNTGLRVQTNTSGGTVASFGGFGDFQIDGSGKAGGRFVVKESGLVGIGITTPTFKLQVIDPSNTGLRVQTNTSGGTVGSFASNGDFQIDAPFIPGGRFVVKESGLVGIGTKAPTTTLQVAGGDISTTTAGNGLIVKSPDGTKCARIGIDNTGALAVTSVTCP